jgi:hypothetical protein
MGAVIPIVPLGFLSLTCHFRLPTRCRSPAGRRNGDGVGDVLVGGVSMPIDAVGVDLEQDGDAAPGGGRPRWPVPIADENDPVTRLARALLTVNDYYQAAPNRLNNLADLTARSSQVRLVAVSGRRVASGRNEQIQGASSGAGPVSANETVKRLTVPRRAALAIVVAGMGRV